MQICCPQIFGKRRHSGEMSDKSQLKAEIFNVILRHWCVTRDFYAKRSTNLAEKTLADVEECKTERCSAKKWTRWSKFTFHSLKNTLTLYFLRVKLKTSTLIRKNKKGQQNIALCINNLLIAITTSRWVIIVINYSDPAHHAYQTGHFLVFQP